MPYVLVRHTVEDYAKWKPIFDEHASDRGAGGSRGGQLMHTADNPNEITILFHWDSIENAQEFVHSDSLRQAMQNAGVVGMPEVRFLDEIEQFGV